LVRSWTAAFDKTLTSAVPRRTPRKARFTVFG
jgi:hypothetical protein